MAQSLEKHKLDCKDLYEYFLTLSSNVLDDLYDHPFTCLAVFGGLPEIAKHYIMRTLFTDQKLTDTFVSMWCKNSQTQLHATAITKLKGLHIWNEISTGTSSVRYDMNPHFRKHLKIGLCGSGNIQEEPLKTVEDKHARDVSFLDKYSRERWECVLYYMTGSQVSENAGESEDVAGVLINSGLLLFDVEAQTTSIASSGFQFLLLDTSTQIWYFMVKYLDSKEGLALVQCLSFLFQISFSTLGKDYGVKNLTEQQFTFLQLLQEIGLAFQSKLKSKRFYPTRLAINLGSAVTGNVSSSAQHQGYLIVETNYRIYAYTDSALQIALLALFADLKSRFPLFTVGVLSRQSVQQALACGITAEQIIDFLRTRAHPQMYSNTPVIPATITDQVKLWEMERERLRYTEGVLYNQFLSQSDYEMLRKHADDMHVLLFSNNQKRLMIVSRAGNDDVNRYWKRNKPS